ncbi:MAG: hypothetical protein ABW066_15310 [Sedimenticola sp.]
MEPLIESERAELRIRIFRFKAQIAGNSQSIAKICNEEVGSYGRKAAVNGLFSGSK